MALATHSEKVTPMCRSFELLYRPYRTDKGKLFVVSPFTDGKTEATPASMTSSASPHSKATGNTRVAYVFNLKVYVTSTPSRLCPHLSCWGILSNLDSEAELTTS